MMNCSARIFSTATSARTRSGTCRSARKRTNGPGPAAARVVAIAADAKRPTSSLVNRLSATDADKVASYLPTAATTGSRDSAARPPSTRRRSPGRTRAPLTWPARQRPLRRPAHAGRCVRRQRRPRRREPSRRRRRPSPSPALPGTPAPGRALPNPYRRFAVVVVEAELPPLAAKPVTTHPRILGDRVQDARVSSAPH